MFAKTVLEVLAAVGEIGVPEAIEMAPGSVDPFLRGVLRRKLRAAVEKADAATTQKNDREHVARLAFVLAHAASPAMRAGDPPPLAIDPNDVRKVHAAFRELARPYLPDAPSAPVRQGYRAVAVDRADPVEVKALPRRTRFWPVTTALTACVVVGALASSADWILPFFRTTPFAAFRKTPFGKALGEPLTDYVASHDLDARARLFDPKVRAQVGGDVAAALDAALADVPAVAGSKEEDPDKALSPLVIAVNALNAKLAAHAVPVLFHTYGRRSVAGYSLWLTSYFVEGRSEITAAGESYRLARGRRLDTLNLEDNSLYKATAEDWIVVSLDKLEEDFVKNVLLSVARGAPLGDGKGAFTDTPAHAYAATAGRLVGAEIALASHFDPGAAEGLYSAVARRNDTLRALEASGHSIGTTDRIELAPSLVRRIAEWKGEPGNGGLVDELLRQNDTIGVYRVGVDPAIAELASIEEDSFVAMLLAKAPPRSEDEDAPPPRFRDDRSAKRASSTLSLLAAERRAPRFALWDVARSLTDQGYSGSDVTGARIAIGSVLEELGLLEDGGNSYVHNAFIDALRQAIELDPARVRAAAKAVHQELFGAPATVLVRRSL